MATFTGRYKASAILCDDPLRFNPPFYYGSSTINAPIFN